MYAIELINFIKDNLNKRYYTKPVFIGTRYLDEYEITLGNVILSRNPDAYCRERIFIKRLLDLLKKCPNKKVFIHNKYDGKRIILLEKNRITISSSGIIFLDYL